MKKIIQIAKLELSLLFYSPIAWLLIVVLFMQMAMANIAATADLQYLLGLKVELTDLTDKLFTTSTAMGTIPIGIFFAILGSLYLYIPLITMGIISRELNSGTVKLLYSSPVKLSQIVYGKFLAMVTYNLVIVGLMSLFAILGTLFIDHFDYPHVLVALLASFLLLSAYAAIGIFMSSLTTYQVIAAIGTFALLAFMNYIGQFGQGLDVVRDLTYSLSMPSRAERLVGGLLTSRDVIYYLVITGIFLGFTIIRLQFARVSKPISVQILGYLLIVAVGLTVAYISSRQPMVAYYDATYIKANTISKNTQDILKKMGDEPVEMTEYINVMDDTYIWGSPLNRISSIARWEPYLRFKSNIKLNWVYYNGSFDQQAFKERAKALEVDTADFLSPEALRKQVNLNGENGRLVIQLKYKGRTTLLRTFEDADFWAKEPEIAVALKRLVVTPPKIVFATDGYQRSVDKIGDRDYKLFFNIKTSRTALINKGFDLDSVAIENSTIPKGIAALVISDPKVAYSKQALARLRQYIAEGGNLLIAGEPGKQSVLNPILDTLGIKMLDGALVQRSRDYSYDLVTPELTAGALGMDPALTTLRRQKGMVTMPGVAALQDEKKGLFKVEPLLITDMKRSWIKQGTFVLDSAALVFDAKRGDQQGAFPTALKLTRKLNHKEQRIIISGDADFFSNKEGWRNMAKVNSPFTLSIFKWFADGKFPVEMIRTNSIDNTMRLNEKGVETLQIFYYGVIPGLILLLGTVLLTRRKRK